MKQGAASQIVPGLWVGDMWTAEDEQFFRKNNITAVLNATPDVPKWFAGPESDVEYMRLNLDDSGLSHDIDLMTKLLPAAVGFLVKNHEIEQKNVLVHCHAGVQRSCTAVAAYLMHRGKCKPGQAVAFIIRKRPVAFFGGKYINFSKSLEHIHARQCAHANR